MFVLFCLEWFLFSLIKPYSGFFYKIKFYNNLLNHSYSNRMFLKIECSYIKEE